MIDQKHLEQKRIEVLYSFAKVRKDISNLIDAKEPNIFIEQLFDELGYLERFIKNMLDILERKKGEV